MTTNSSAENHRPTIYIDADGCPVVDITIRVARAKHLSCIILCDISHVFEKEGAKTITVSKGAEWILPLHRFSEKRKKRHNRLWSSAIDNRDARPTSDDHWA